MGTAGDDRVAKDYPPNAENEERNLKKPFVNEFKDPARNHYRNEADEKSHGEQMPSWLKCLLLPSSYSDKEKS